MGIDHELFERLLKNLLDVNVVNVSDMNHSLYAFQDSFCYNEQLQPMFTKDALHYLLSSEKEGTFYEIVDYLDICITFFSLDNNRYIIGPYVKSEFSDTQAESILLEKGITNIRLLPLKLYYTKFPILYTDYLQKTLGSLIASFSPNTSPFTYRKLSGFVQEASSSVESEEYSSKDYSRIYRRYDLENAFLSMIRNGDVENLRSAYKNMGTSAMNTAFTKDVVNYYNFASSFAIIRALARKAAEQSGLSVIIIDSITQKYVQLSSSTTNLKTQQNYIYEMLKELTEAVRNHRLSLGSYTPPIRKAIEYIDLHLSEPLSLNGIADASDLSASHFSRLFKSETGETAMDFIATQRCKKAASLLVESTLPIQEIGSYVGYSDNNYFVKVFKKIYCMTPSDYRKDHHL